jgi:hypothetical protein
MIKAKDLPAEVVENRSVIILKALYTNNAFELKLNIKQLANWPVQKRRQIFRLIINNLIKSSFSYYHPYSKYLRSKSYQTWRFPMDILQGALTNRFLKEVKSLEETERFAPEKVTTIPIAPTSMLMNDPEIFDYLLNKNIVNLGKNFRFTSTHTNYIKEELRRLKSSIETGRRHGIDSLEEFIDSNINLDIMFHPDKLRLKLASNMVDNLNIFFQHLKKENKNYSNKELQNFNEMSTICKHALTEILTTTEKFYSTDLEVLEEVISKKIKGPFKIEMFSPEIYDRLSAPIIRKFRILMSDINQELIPEEVYAPVKDITDEVGFDPENTKLIAE